MTNRKTLLVICSFIAFIATLLALYTWIVPRPRVQITGVSFPPLKITFEPPRINGFLGAYFYSETRKEYVWCININNEPMEAITYGMVPHRGTQTIPKEGAPRALKVGEKVFLQLVYQYDSWMDPYVESKTWAIQVEADNKAKNLGQFSNIVLPPITE